MLNKVPQALPLWALALKPSGTGCLWIRQYLFPTLLLILNCSPPLGAWEAMIGKMEALRALLAARLLYLTLPSALSPPIIKQCWHRLSSIRFCILSYRLHTMKEAPYLLLGKSLVCWGGGWLPGLKPPGRPTPKDTKRTLSLRHLKVF